MVVHRRKKSKKKSWRRAGEKRRGAGNRGGRGRAGFGKRAAHKKALAIKLGMLPGYENKGFTSLKKKEKIITLDQINEIAWRLKREGKELKINVLEMGFEKVVGRGNLNFPVEVVARSFTKGALEKIEKAGGKAVEVH